MSDTITCPSGFTGRLRGMKVREERILADRKLAKSGGQLDELLAACWEETHDPGPYTFDGKADWGRVLQGDRFYALLRLRCLTYGPEYAFSVTCAEEACRRRIPWELSLLDLPVQALSAASRSIFLAGNRFETRLPGAGTRLWFKLLLGADERSLVALRRTAGERALSAALGYRIVEIEGTDAKDRRGFLEELSMSDADFLQTEFERVDCGVETAIDIECPDCWATQEIELPFDRGFFLPSKGSARSPASTASSPT
jgi:hypothetical protein